MAIDEDYSVFLSFSGEVREKFACHLFKALESKEFQPFMDSENILLGDDINERIKKAIKHSKSAIVIISDEYASSNNCLNELLLILTFYYVETDDVKRQLGNFGAEFECIKKMNNDNIVEEWRAALANIGGILGKEMKEKE